MVPVPVRDWGDAIFTSITQALALFLAAIPKIIFYHHPCYRLACRVARGERRGGVIAPHTLRGHVAALWLCRVRAQYGSPYRFVRLRR